MDDLEEDAVKGQVINVNRDGLDYKQNGPKYSGTHLQMEGCHFELQLLQSCEAS